MEPFLKELLSEYGPLALGWIVAATLGWRVFTDAAAGRVDARDVLKQYHDLIRLYHEAVVDNTKVTERLAMLIEDRTRRQINGQ